LFFLSCDRAPRHLHSFPTRRSSDLGGSYDVAVDSKNKVWYTQEGLGILVRFDPQTGQHKPYKIPGVVSSRGIAIDAKDTIWYSRSEEHTSELQSRGHLVCRLLLEKK